MTHEAVCDKVMQVDTKQNGPRDSKVFERAMELARQKRGWHVKPLTALVSSFEEVILMDADALPLQPPERFFDHPQLQPREDFR